MMKKTVALLPALFIWFAMPAQTTDFKKGEVRMAISDTLQEFDYHFDYSVFDSPYKGAYEFSPYFVQMTPDKSEYDGRNFWLRGGAGYTLHPVLDFVWTPVRKPNVALTVLNSGKGYVGNYIFGPTENVFSGHDIDDKLGFQADFIGKSHISRLTGGWNGIFTKTGIATSGYNSFNIDFDIKSMAKDVPSFQYDFDLGYKYASDNLGSLGFVSDHTVSLVGSVAPVVLKNFRLLVDFRGDLESLQSFDADLKNFTHFFVDATPHIVFSAGIFALDAGLAIDYSHTDKGQLSFLPSVKASVAIIKDVFDFYAAIVGGQKMHTYSSLKEYNHFAYAMTPEVTLVRYNVFGGFKGAVGSHFDYDLKVGYMVGDNALIDFPTIQYGNVSKMYIDISAAWRSDRLEVDGNLSFAPIRNLYSGIGFQTPLYNGDIRAMYNWNKRIYAGASLKLMSPRKCPDIDFKWVPMYADLGIICEYKFSRTLGVWAEGGNLLGHRVYDVVGYIAKSPYFTLGISCTL